MKRLLFILCAIIGAPLSAHAQAVESAIETDVFGRVSGDCTATSAGVHTCPVPDSKVTFTDNTSGNVSPSAHGYAPKAPNDATKYLDGTGNYSVPPVPAPAYRDSQAQVNSWYPFYPDDREAGGTTTSINTIYCIPSDRDRPATFGGLGVRVTTADATNHVQLALYDDYQGRPGHLLGATADLSLASNAPVSGGMLLNGSAVTVQVGIGTIVGRHFWRCKNTNSSTAVMSSLDVAGLLGASMIGSPNIGDLFTSNAAYTGISCAGVNCNGATSAYGTWPSLLVGSTWNPVNGSGKTTLIEAQVVSDP